MSFDSLARDQKEIMEFDYGLLNLDRIDELIKEINNGKEIVPYYERDMDAERAAKTLGISRDILNQLVVKLNVVFPYFDMDGYSDYAMKAIIYVIASIIESKFMQECSARTKLSYMHEQVTSKKKE